MSSTSGHSGTGKRDRGSSFRASCSPVGVLKVEVELDGKRSWALVDTGCSYTLVRAGAGLSTQGDGEGVVLETMDGKSIRTRGKALVKSMVMAGKQLGPRIVQVMQSLPLDVDLVIGLDMVLDHGLVVTSTGGGVRVDLGRGSQPVGQAGGRCEAALAGNKTQMSDMISKCRVSDKDFEATFDGGKWTMKWKWKTDNPSLSCSRPNYKVPKIDREAFNDEIKIWVKEGILVPWSAAEHGAVKNVIPLMSVHQTKGDVHKIRPVLDFRLTNGNIVCLSGGLPTCDERLRQWRSKGCHGSLIDLRRAYLQVHVDKSLWVYQAVRWEGQMYLLTRLGFGLSVAPKVMTAIVEKVLGLDDKIWNESSNYIDDIYCTGGRQLTEATREHLERFGLVTKEAVHVGVSSVRILGLSVDTQRTWSRDGKLPVVASQGLTRRELHSWIGELVGHYPVAGWLRVACGYLQRCTAAEKVDWDRVVSQETQSKVNDVVAMLRERGDPVRGQWAVDCTQPAVLWSDASSLAIGVALQIGGSIVEDASWLRKSDDSAHINMSELDAVIRGITLCLRWGIRQFTVRTDSATVFGWLKAVFERTHKVRTHALGEMLIRRRLEMLSELATQERLEVAVEQVASADNKSDQLTRVPKKWLLSRKPTEVGHGNTVSLAAPAVMIDGRQDLQADVTRIHERHHFGVDRTLELARQKLGVCVTRKMVKAVVSECRQCAMVDPAVTFRWEKGTIATSSVWQRLAVDITHVNGRPYMSCIDCCSRYTIWRALRDESMKEVCTYLAQIFAEMGPVEELFSDNGKVFRSAELGHLLDIWNIKADFSCAYRAQGNGLVERVHRTVKRMVARSGRSVEEMTFWYNATRGEQPASPFELLFGAKPRMPGVTDKRQEVQRTWDAPEVQQAAANTRVDIERNPFVVGDQVFLKQDSRCDRPWSGPHRVTDIKSSVSVALNGSDIPRHVSHIRRVPVSRAVAEYFSGDAADDEEDPMAETEQSVTRYPVRDRIAPQRYGMDDAAEPLYH